VGAVFTQEGHRKKTALVLVSFSFRGFGSLTGTTGIEGRECTRMERNKTNDAVRGTPACREWRMARRCVRGRITCLGLAGVRCGEASQRQVYRCEIDVIADKFCEKNALTYS
jgi:hypothetical protein